MKKLVILGSTGSIGRNTLDVVRQFPDNFKVVGLSAGSNVSLLAEQIKEFKPKLVCVKSLKEAELLKSIITSFPVKPEVLYDEEGYCEIASCPEADMIVSAMVGAVGLKPTLKAVEAGKDIALANKETLVIAGAIVTKEADLLGVKILPVDSEHNAIFQALEGHNRAHLKKIILTASGGPFFKLDRDKICKVTVEEALKHPTWAMGKKITIDSATLMNKGLEIIEAHWLFKVSHELISVHIHPESIVHSMVEYIDGSIIAHLAIPDMRIPIAYALSYPERLPLKLPSLNLFEIKSLSFFEPDEEKFPCLRLARESCSLNGTMPAVLNAANEIAVEAFLNREIGFCDIPKLVERVMEKHLAINNNPPASDIETVMKIDRWAREETLSYIRRGF